MSHISLKIFFVQILSFIFIYCLCTEVPDPSVYNEENLEERPVHYKLLKLLDFQIDHGRGSPNISKVVEDIISEFQIDVRGGEKLDPSIRAERSNLCCGSNEGSCVEKYYEAIIESLKVLNELKSEIAELKKNMPVKPEVLPSAQKTDLGDFEGVCYPVGVDKYRFCRRGYPLNRDLNRDGKSNETIAKSCNELLRRGNIISGVYLIRPKGIEEPLRVLCDMETRGGGWIHIQKRFDGSEDFFREFREYKLGFGDLAGEFWLGLESIHKMTASAPKELLVEIVDRKGKVAYVQYKTFEIGSEVDGYTLEVLTGHSGDLGDSLAYSVGRKFSTKDFDRDGYTDGSCANLHSGGWWYNRCSKVCLNGRYLNTELTGENEYSGIHWFSSRGNNFNYAKSRMMIRTVEE